MFFVYIGLQLYKDGGLISTNKQTCVFLFLIPLYNTDGLVYYPAWAFLQESCIWSLLLEIVNMISFD